MPRYYKMDDYGETSPCDLDHYGRSFDDCKNRVLRQTKINDQTLVSTVFLGLDHAFFGGPPIIFETMIFSEGNEELDCDQDRCSTFDEAITMHNKMLKKATSFFEKSGIDVSVEESTEIFKRKRRSK